MSKQLSNRQGAVYVAVLMASLIVASLAMSSALVAYRLTRVERDEGNLRRAQLLADSGLEWAVASINQNPNWRTTLANNVDTAPTAIDSGTVTYRVIDPDGNLSDRSLDTCDLLVTARVDGAAHAWRCGLEPAGTAVNCLNYSVASTDNIALNFFGVWSSDQTYASSGNISTAAIFSNLTANCNAAGSISGSIVGTQSSLPVALEMPDVVAMEYYVRAGSKLSVATLPLVNGDRVLSAALLSSTANTVTGQVNSKGIYIIDGGGGGLLLRNSRLQATLVVQNASRLTIDSAVFWEAPQGQLPCLLADCPVTLDIQRNALQESAIGINLNPASTPYRGRSDSNTTSRYPSQLRGLFFTTRAVTVDISAETELIGCLLCKGLSGSGKLLSHYRSVFASNPPPGFRKGPTMTVSPGTVRRVTAP